MDLRTRLSCRALVALCATSVSGCAVTATPDDAGASRDAELEPLWTPSTTGFTVRRQFTGHAHAPNVCRQSEEVFDAAARSLRVTRCTDDPSTTRTVMLSEAQARELIDAVRRLPYSEVQPCTWNEGNQYTLELADERRSDPTLRRLALSRHYCTATEIEPSARLVPNAAYLEFHTLIGRLAGE